MRNVCPLSFLPFAIRDSHAICAPTVADSDVGRPRVPGIIIAARRAGRPVAAIREVRTFEFTMDVDSDRGH